MNKIVESKKANVATIEEVLVSGNLSSLTPYQRLDYYQRLCDTLKLNPLTKPFEYITLNGKLVLYATKGCTDQLRKVNGISIYKLEKFTENDIHIVTAYARDDLGREDVSTGAVNIGNLKGEALANAYLKAETKAKRRVTLSIGGLGMLDETEIESIKTVNPKAVVEPNFTDKMEIIQEAVKEPEATVLSNGEPLYKVDGKMITGLELHNLINEAISEIKNEEDLMTYDWWKSSNYAAFVDYSKKNKEISSTYAKSLTEKRKELKL